MKKILTILLCGVLVFGITGCDNTKKESDMGSKSDFEKKYNVGNKSNIIALDNDVSMSIKDGTLTDTSATIILTNNSDKDFRYGNPYTIEVKKDGEWHKIDVELYFTMIAYGLQAGESKEIKLDWEDGYGKLASGTYRIIKNISYEKEDGTSESFNIAVEFNIDSD